MFRRHSRILIAVAGLVLVALAFGVGALYSPYYKQNQAVGRDGAAADTYKGVSRSLPDIAGVPGPVERAIANPAPETGEDHEKRDLAAQESMSVWGFYMAVFAGLTALITGFGTYFIAVQVRLTKEAVKDTGDATRAMEKANDLARITLMPLVVAERPTGQFGDMEEAPGIFVCLKNKGSGIARSVKVYGSGTIDGTEPDLAKAALVEFREAFGSDDKIAFHSYKVLSVETSRRVRDAWNQPAFTMRVWVRIEFQDVFGTPYSQTYGAIFRKNGRGVEEEQAH